MICKSSRIESICSTNMLRWGLEWVNFNSTANLREERLGEQSRDPRYIDSNHLFLFLNILSFFLRSSKDAGAHILLFSVAALLAFALKLLLPSV